MGITIHWRGGKVPEKTVDNIISQLEEQFKRQGYVEGCKDPVTGTRRSRCYDKYSEPVSESENKYQKTYTLSEEKSSNEYWARERERRPNDVSYEEELPDGTTREVLGREAAQRQRERFQDKVRRGVIPPDSFSPMNEKMICLNPDPHSETFCVRFMQDDSEDRWYAVRESCKTQFVKQEGVHIELCEYLSDIQKKMRDVGSDLLIEDEGDYCDDYGKTQGDRDKLVKNTDENRKLIDSIGQTLAGIGWNTPQKVEVTVKPAPIIIERPPPEVPEGVPTGTLEDWMMLREADLLVSVKPSVGIRMLRVIPKLR